MLSDNLDDPGEKGIVEREIISEKPFRVEYSLTGHGRSLEPILVAIRDWDIEQLTEPTDEDCSTV